MKGIGLRWDFRSCSMSAPTPTSDASVVSNIFLWIVCFCSVESMRGIALDNVLRGEIFLNLFGINLR